VVATQNGYTVWVSNFQRHQKLQKQKISSKGVPNRKSHEHKSKYPRLTWLTRLTRAKAINTWHTQKENEATVQHLLGTTQQHLDPFRG